MRLLLKPSRTILAWSVFGLLVLLVLTEGLLRFALQLGCPPLYDLDSMVEYQLHPKQDLVRLGSRYSVNSLGMRCAEPDDRRMRVLVLGDSVVNGGVPIDQGQTATSLSEFSDPTKRQWLQASAASWGPPNMLAWLQIHGDAVRPARIVVVLSSHDRYDVPQRLPLDPRTHPTSRPLCAVSDLISTYGTRWIFPSPQEPPHTLNNEAICSQSLVAVASWARARQIDMAVVVHPERNESVDSADCRFWIKLCEAAGLRCVPEFTSEEDRTGLFRDSIHLTVKGNWHLASRLLSIWP